MNLLQQFRTAFSFILIAALCLLLVGCSALQSIPDPLAPLVNSDDEPDQSDAVVQPDEVEVLPSQGGLPDYTGQIAAIGADGNLYLFKAGQEPEQLTDDAIVTSSRFRSLRYAHPSWSRDGWLSYARFDLLDEEKVDIYAIRPGETSAVNLFSVETRQEAFSYGAWSPMPCNDGPHCAHFAYIVSDGQNTTLHLTEVNADMQARDELISPPRNVRMIYFSWSPEGDSMFQHFINERLDTLSVYDVGRPRLGSYTLEETPGVFHAPVWSPVDDRLMFTAVDVQENEVSLRVSDFDEESRFGLPGDERAYLSWSPGGEYIAYASGDTFPLSPITILNLESGEELRLDDLTDIVSFYWSPDGEKLAIIRAETIDGSDVRRRLLNDEGTPIPQPSPIAPEDEPRIRLRWYVIEPATENVTAYNQFIATHQQAYYLQFFDQFAQTDRVWSPDSRYIVYAETNQDFTIPSVKLLDTTQPDAEPITLLHGISANFSFGE